MTPGEASRTAEYAAGFRALETVRRPARDRLFEDPLAKRFLRPSLRLVVRCSGVPLAGPLVRGYVDRRWPGAMTSGIARTRLIDDLLRASLERGIERVVLLGAGYDCRAHRMPELARCQVVEVDHPATQAAKRARLATGIDPGGEGVTYVAADLTRADLSRVLSSAGVDREQRVFVLWEGVTHYLGRDAVDTTLRTLARCAAPGSRVLFTYIHHGLIDGTQPFDGAGASRDQVARHGEPWIWGWDPAQLAGYLRRRGLVLLEDHGADEYRARYWGDRGRRMRGFGFYHASLAEVVDGDGGESSGG